MTKENSEWVEWGKAIVVALLVAFILRSFVFATSIVEGESMEPTLEDGERVIFNKIVYLLDEPDRGDVVIIERPSKNYVKRIIGLPGETIEIRHSELYINGERYEQTFLNEIDLQRTGNIGQVHIPEGSYYVMGDNRAISKDSRNGLGFIEEESIIGKTEVIIYPFSEWAVTR
ncbi:signal peptidase I [Virgibacillus sediminis]|uniref:Signal peptidase I n=1 Tax=Virgibacillus sediminis TaxID=202260 RepID=A0ABV7AAZ1_9BACI